MYARRFLTLYFSLVYAGLAVGAEYLYPVAQSRDGAVCVIYQKSPSHIELWLWDKETKKISPGLLSRFTPAGISLLPDRRAFSFINNDMLMVKQFLKRSPGSLEFSQPLYDLTLPVWTSENACCISARKRERNGIFYVDRCGEVGTIIWDGVYDYLYPQKVGDDLFCVMRTGQEGERRHQIIKIRYPQIETGGDCVFDEKKQLTSPCDETLSGELRGAIFEPAGNYEMVGGTNVAPASFLNMVSGEVGYFVSHPASVGQKMTLVPFSYHRVAREGGSWTTRQLFSFELPLDLLLFDPVTRLYESVLPLLPQRIGDSIYFSQVTRGECGVNVNLFRYHEATDQIEQLSFASRENEHFFRPFDLGDCVMCGGTLADDESAAARMWFGDDGELYTTFPILN